MNKTFPKPPSVYSTGSDYVDPYGERKFYKGSGKRKERNIDTWEDKKQDKILSDLIKNRPKTKAIYYTCNQIIQMLKKANLPLTDDQIEFMNTKSRKEVKSKNKPPKQ